MTLHRSVPNNYEGTSVMGGVFCCRIRFAAALIASLLGSASQSQAAIQVVDQVPVLVGSPAIGQWYSSTASGGSATLESLLGVGGNLENNRPLQPASTGAGLLTTNLTDPSRASVTTYNNYGLASFVLNNINLAYGYYKGVLGDPDENLAAAPAMRLRIEAPSGDFGTLIYEPYWNLGVANPPAGAWQSVSIDPTTGGGDGENVGGWWWSGTGFNTPNGAGGPPILSLAQWAAELADNDGADFATAIVSSLSIGVGTYNRGQIGYFDAVSIQVGTQESTTYDFEPSAAIPEPITVFVWSLGGCLALAVAGRQRDV